MNGPVVTESLDEQRWQAVLERDAGDGSFFYGVLTTGIYCLPGCPSRAPRRENVAFFDSIGGARAAGLRPCKRCHPDARGVPDWFEGAARALMEGEAAVAEVAASVGVSRATLHRTSVEVLGVTPSALRRSARDARFREALASRESVLDACFDAGFGSASAAYARSARTPGVAPRTLGGRTPLSLRVLVGDSSLGPMVAAATESGLCLLEFLDEGDDAETRVRARFPDARIERAAGADEDLLERAIASIDAPEKSRALPTDVRGTAFQQQVWAALRKLADGEQVSYSELATRMGRPSATRAVARAVSENPLAVLVPCHRVVAKGGKLGGYRWGVERKAQLLERERGGD